MATDLTQLLNWEAVCNKLGGSSNSSEIPNRGQISSNWGNAVYFDYYLASNNKVIPNNGQIWPVKSLKFGTSPEDAYNGNYSSYVFKNTSWDEDDPYDFSVGTLYQKTSASNLPAASTGYYMEDDDYTWYRISSGGTIAEVGYYIPNSFYFTNGNSLELGTEYNNSASHSCSSSSTSTSIRSQVAYNISGASSTSGNFVNASINNAGTSVTFTRRSGGYNSSYPMVVVEYGFSNSSDFMLIHPPWSISAGNATVSNALHANYSPSITTNMRSYELSVPSNVSWIDVNSDGTSLYVYGNGGYSTRSATVTVTGNTSGSWGNVEYDSGDISTTFTLTQEAASASEVIYVIIFKNTPEKALISASQNSYVAISGGLPNGATINIRGMRVQQEGLGDIDDAHFGINSASFTTAGSHYISLRWIREPGPSGSLSVIGVVNSSGTVTASGLPSNYSLGSTTVNFINGASPI